MTAQTITITYATGTPQQLTTSRQMCCIIRIEPFQTNTGLTYIGLAGITKATGAKVVTELAAPNNVVTAGKGVFEITGGIGANMLDASDYWLDGTNLEKALVTIWTA